MPPSSTIQRAWLEFLAYRINKLERPTTRSPLHLTFTILERAPGPGDGLRGEKLTWNVSYIFPLSPLRVPVQFSVFQLHSFFCILSFFCKGSSSLNKTCKRIGKDLFFFYFSYIYEHTFAPTFPREHPRVEIAYVDRKYDISFWISLTIITIFYTFFNHDYTCS